MRDVGNSLFDCNPSARNCALSESSFSLSSSKRGSCGRNPGGIKLAWGRPVCVGTDLPSVGIFGLRGTLLNHGIDPRQPAVPITFAI